VFRHLDLCSCAGGGAVGFSRAGLDVYVNDIVPRPNNPFPMYVGDGLEVLDALLAGAWVGFRAKNGDIISLNADDIDSYSVSPPCQAEGTLAKGTNAKRGSKFPRLIGPFRDRLDKLGKPYVIENVKASSVRKDIMLWGPDFDLGVLQDRYFELGFWKTEQPETKPKKGKVRGYNHGKWHDGPYVQVYGKGGGKATVAEAQKAKGIDWTDDWVELCEAIPPAYTEWIGRRLIEHLGATT
jgi:hypothetical protein